MYESYFKFSNRPFSSTAQVEHYFPASSIEDARVRLVRCIDRGEGPAMVIGPAGSGKTLLCQVLKKHFQDKYPVVLLGCGRLSTRKALLQAILYELGRPYRRMDEGELRIALRDYLMADVNKSTDEDESESGKSNQPDQSPKPTAVVLLVDEAQNLPLRLLEEIRMLSNLADANGPKIRLVLCGGAILEERFAGPRLESFSQRIVARCYLETFNRSETQDYLRSRIEEAGSQGESMFDDTTCKAVYQATDGVPRLVNQVCDHALVLAYVAGRERLRARDIEEAWADLQQLPTPWSDEDTGESSAAGGDSGIVEFGGLDDEDDFAAATSGPSLSVGFGDEEENEDVETVSMNAVDRIEQSLTDLDDDFQPAGTIGPEVELTFGEADNPFEEEFEEEEVISRRYESTSSQTASPQLTTDTSSRPMTHNEPQRATAMADYGRPDVLLMEKVAQPQPAKKTTAAKTHQYNQLFAKLRRG